MTKQHFSFIIIFAIGVFTFSCKEKPVKKEPVPVAPQPVIEDTIPVDTVPEEIVEELPEPPKAPNRFFLIAASFQKQSNADRYREKLIAEGYDSEVIIRQVGANPDFYKVSYKGFSDKNHAFQELRNDMANGPFQEIWLLIK